jgi:glyoxylase-like metal-dependent hydrolase (beta-lactamase superfamily II)
MPNSGETPLVWEAYAIRYAHHHRMARENFIGGDIHNGPMPMDYFIWVVRSAERVYVVDTGFDEAVAKKRGRTFLHSPGDGLRKIGIEPSQVQDVIVTHMHYDHSGNHEMFPQATYHVQDREMQFCTGRYMTHAAMRLPFDAEDVCAFVRKIYGGRVVFHDGDTEIAPGLSVHFVGGHSMGLQMVRVWTRRGWVVLASDASHYYANMDLGLVYPFTFHVGDTLEGYRRARELADSGDHIVPGHDPEVLKRYPAAGPGLDEWIVKLDQA